MPAGEPRVLLIDGGSLAAFGRALSRIGIEPTTVQSFDRAIAELTPDRGAVIYFDPVRIPLAKRFEAHVRERGTVAHLIAVDLAGLPQADEGGWHAVVVWPQPPDDLRAAVAQHLSQARDKRLLFEIGSRFAKSLHDLRTPLGGIKGYASTLALHWDRMTEADRREAVQIIEAEVDQVTRLLDDLSNVERDLRRGEWRG